jgi:hypothetical protein
MQPEHNVCTNALFLVLKLVLDSVTIGLYTGKEIYYAYLSWLWAGMSKLVWRLAEGWTVWRPNRGDSDIFCTRPDRLCDPTCLLYNAHRVFLVDKAAGAWH